LFDLAEEPLHDDRGGLAEKGVRPPDRRLADEPAGHHLLQDPVALVSDIDQLLRWVEAPQALGEVQELIYLQVHRPLDPVFSFFRLSPPPKPPDLGEEGVGVVSW